MEPPLKPLHPEASLVDSKLDAFRRLPDNTLVDSLKPGRPGALKVKPDGTIMDGHHRIAILRERGVDVDRLPRELLEPED